MAWTTTDLLSAIKNTQMIPDASTGSLSPDVLLQYATETLHLQLMALILGVREKYYETYTDTSYTTSTTSIVIPARSIGETIASLQYLYGTDIKPLEPIDPSQVATTQPAAQPNNFYFENNSVVFYPPPSASQGTIRMRYFQRPNRLAQTSNCAQITAFDSGTGVVTASIPTTWTTSNTFDFIPQTASHATPYGKDSAISAVTSTTITFTSLPSATAIGDWIALAEYTPIPELPFEFQSLLAQMTARRALQAINDSQGLANSQPIIQETIEAAVKILTPRDQYGSKRVVSGWRQF